MRELLREDEVDCARGEFGVGKFVEIIAFLIPPR